MTEPKPGGRVRCTLNESVIVGEVLRWSSVYSTTDPTLGLRRLPGKEHTTYIRSAGEGW